MTTENQIAIALGWKWVKATEETFAHWENSKGWFSDPPSFNTLDQMQSAVLAQDEEFQYHFAINLNRRLQNRHAKLADKHGTLAVEAVHQLTLADWQESFVETLKQLGRLK